MRERAGVGGDGQPGGRGRGGRAGGVLQQAVPPSGAGCGRGAARAPPGRAGPAGAAARGGRGMTGLLLTGAVPASPGRERDATGEGRTGERPVAGHAGARRPAPGPFGPPDHPRSLRRVGPDPRVVPDAGSRGPARGLGEREAGRRPSLPRVPAGCGVSSTFSHFRQPGVRPPRTARRRHLGAGHVRHGTDPARHAARRALPAGAGAGGTTGAGALHRTRAPVSGLTARACSPTGAASAGRGCRPPRRRTPRRPGPRRRRRQGRGRCPPCTTARCRGAAASAVGGGRPRSATSRHLPAATGRVVRRGRPAPGAGPGRDSGGSPPAPGRRARRGRRPGRGDDGPGPAAGPWAKVNEGSSRAC